MQHVHQHFIEPLTALFRIDANEPKAFLRALAEELAQFTPHALSSAAKEIRRTRKFQTFPSIAECVEVTKSMPDYPRGKIVGLPVARSGGTAPILVAAEKYVFEFETGTQAKRDLLEKQQPGRYAAALNVIKAYSKKDDGHMSETPEARAAKVREIFRQYR